MKTIIFSTLLLLQVHLFSCVWSALPPPTNVTMDSVDLRHILKWGAPPVPCNTTLRYSVQFQGEFERTFGGGTWLDSPQCQNVTHTQCDQTLDLGSDSDYDIRVRAHCEAEMSEWAKLSQAFNRLNTSLTAPQMKVSAVGDALLVTFERAPPTASIEVEVRNQDNVSDQALFTISADQKMLHLPVLLEVKYCVRARVLLNEKCRSQDTEEECVLVTGPEAPWKCPTTVVLTLLLMVGVAVITFWGVVQYRTRRSIRRKSSLRLLINDWPVPVLLGEPEELCAKVWVLPKDQLLQPEHNANT